MINVLHIIGSLRLGGAQVVVKQIAENSDRERFRHYIYPLRAAPIDIDINAEIIKNTYPNYDPRKFFDILRLCKRLDIDIIHAHLSKPIMGAILAKYFTKCKVVIHEHGPILRKGLQYSFYRLFLKIFYKKTNAIIVVSKQIYNLYHEKYRVSQKNLKLVYNSFDFNQFSRGKYNRYEVRRRLGLAENDITLGYIGRFHFVKGCDLLPDVLIKLIILNSHYKLLLIGKGPLESKLKQRCEVLKISDKVIFTGFVKNPAEIMSAFDIFVMPSRQEPFGLAAIESMAMGIPLVTSGVDGLGEFCVDGENCLVCRENTLGDITTCVKRIVNDPDLAEKISINGMKTAKKFSQNTFVANIENLYQGLGQTVSPESVPPSTL